jgi:hypothetical protein
MPKLSAAELIAALGVAVAAVGFVIGLYQYYIAQKWKKSEFAAKLLEELANDERLTTCCKLLDYSTRKLVVPSPYRPLTAESIFLHDWEALAAAMSPEAEVGSFEWQAVLYRDLFDYFFGYLERINHYIDIGLITAGDVSSLRYWLRQIASPRFAKNPIFHSFIQAYGYAGVIALTKKYGIEYPQEHGSA